METQVFRALTTSFEFAVVLFRFTQRIVSFRAHRPEEICARNLRGQRAHSAAGANGKPNA
jgi:hypothetical protein